MIDRERNFFFFFFYYVNISEQESCHGQPVCVKQAARNNKLLFPPHAPGPKKKKKSYIFLFLLLRPSCVIYVNASSRVTSLSELSLELYIYIRIYGDRREGETRWRSICEKWSLRKFLACLVSSNISHRFVSVFSAKYLNSKPKTESDTEKRFNRSMHVIFYIFFILVVSLFFILNTMVVAYLSFFPSYLLVIVCDKALRILLIGSLLTEIGTLPTERNTTTTTPVKWR